MNHSSVHFIHKWVGILIGFFIFISCLSGAILLIGKLSGSQAEFYGWVKTLHRSLFLGNSGRLIVGVATLLLILEIATGYWLWFKLAKALTHSAQMRGAGKLYGLRQSLSWTRPNLLFGLHVGPGVWVAIPLLLMAVTGLTWSFEWWNTLIYLLFDPTGQVNSFHTIHALHVGSFFGSFSRLLWLAATLLGASLPITGLLILLRNKHHNHH